MAKQIKKVGINDVEPDLLDMLIRLASHASLIYDDTVFKADLEKFKKDLETLKTTGAASSFNKTKDKVTKSMLDDELLDILNKASKTAVDDIGKTDSKNKEIEKSISDIKTKHANDKNSQNIVNKKYEDEVDALKKIVKLQPQNIKELNKKIDTYSEKIMVGATGTSDGETGLAPTPLKWQYDYLLLGNATWCPRYSLTFGRAVNDVDGNPIKDYIKNIDIKDGKLVVTNGNGKVDEFDNPVIDSAIILTDDRYKMKDIYPEIYQTMTEVPDKLDTKKLTTMREMFSGCESLKRIPSINTKKVTNMAFMFSDCQSITKIPYMDTSNVTDMGNLFNGCISLLEIPSIDTKNVTDMRSMFSGCRMLKEIPYIDTSKVVSMNYMFGDCWALIRIPEINTSKVKDFSCMFSGCSNLIEVPKMNTSNGIDFRGMFILCCEILEIPELNTQNAKNLIQMFYCCYKLKIIHGEIDMKSCLEAYTDPYSSSVNTGYAGMFVDCCKLDGVKLQNVPKSFNAEKIGIKGDKYTIVSYRD